ncbi:MAG: tyrosine-type recombinase/integrase [Candidatus Bathyarchaeia archaeon]
MLSPAEVETDPTVQLMLKRRTLAGETRSNYIKGVRFFCEYFKAKPQKVVEAFKGLNGDQIVERFSEFFAWAKDKVAPKSAWGWLPGVRAWLVENGVREVDRVGRDIAREFRRRFGSPKPLLKRDIVTKEEIIRILKIAPLREKAIICTMASGGFRLSACLNLQLKHFKDDIINNPTLPCYCVEIPETLSKEGEPYLTFISAEAAEYIRTTLALRMENGEKIGPETYLFITKKKGVPLSSKRFENIWRTLCRQAGLDLKPVKMPGLHPIGKKGGGVKYEVGNIRYNTRIHSLRKFFKTACSISGCDRLASEAFLGHSLSKFGVESLYDYCISKLEWLKSEYLKVLPNVTFLKSVPTIPMENHEARRKIEELTRELNETRRKLEEFEELKGLVDKMAKELRKMQRATALWKKAEELQKWLGGEEE